MIMEGRPSLRDPAPTVAGAEAPAPWPQALLAALALLVPGLALIGWPGLSSWHRVLVFGSYLFILLGLLADWVRGFPRWSYPYVGYSLLYALWLSTVSTPGLKLLGYAFTPNEVWDWRAWLGLGVVAVFALLLTRSLRPLGRLFIGAWRDWTRLSLALYGCLPFVMWLFFDEVRQPYPIPFLTATSLFLAAGALAYMRSRTAMHRMLSLLAGLTAAWLISSVGLVAYWTVRREPYWRIPPSWSEATLPMVYAWVVVVAILLVPVILSLLRRVAHPRRTA
jgi:hypothetical protein